MRIFATGDNHLGKTLKMRKALREIGIGNFLDIPDKVENFDETIDYVVFSGDVFDKENADIQSNHAFAMTLLKLTKIKTLKKIFLITGNHDQFNDYFDVAGIDICKIIESDKIVTCNKDDLFYFDKQENVLFYLLPYNKELFLNNEVGTKRIIDRINDAILKIMNEPEYSSAYKIMVSHFAIQEWMPFGSEVVSIDELRAGSHFDLIILGDLHNETFMDLKEIPNIIYTGSTMHTTITDLYNHKNSAKVITVEDNQAAVETIEFYTPAVIVIDKDNLDLNKDQLNEKSIVITSDLEIHNIIKDRVLYSMYKPVANKDQNVLDEFDSEESLETLDVEALAIKKIDEDITIDEETKKFLKFLVSIDVASTTKKDLSDIVYNKVMEGVK